VAVDEVKRAPGSASDVAPTRRRLLTVVGAGLGMVAAGEVVWLVGSFLRPKETADDALGTVVAGPAEDFAPGTVTAFPAGRFYLVRLDDGGFLALARECTHLGCTVPWVAAEGRFTCPCHASAFTITGEVLSPPAPRPLDAYPVRIENGIVKVVAGTLVRRHAFDPSQLVYA
jgi:cytochrome b6-f complex iron-sulfur subunit